MEWISVKDRLPRKMALDMSFAVLTISTTNQMSVKNYDYELGRWTMSPHVIVTHWMELPPAPQH